MRLRLAMQPFWVRALLQGAIFAVLFGVGMSFSSPPRALSIVIPTLLGGAFFGLAMAYTSQSMCTALTEAVAGLDETRRSQAIAAVTNGGVPPDSAVRSAAIRLGGAYLRWKSDAQLKRQERQTWLMLGILVAAAIVAVTISSSTREVIFYVVLMLLVIVMLPIGVLRIRQIQRNVALLTEGPVAG